MRTFLGDGDPSSIFPSSAGECAVADRPGLALLYAVTGGLMELLGPLFWATLIILLVGAELGSSAAIDADQFQPAVNGVTVMLPPPVSTPYR